MQKPIFVHTNLEEFRKSNEIIATIDTYEEQLEDLFLIRNPQYKFNKDYQADFKSFLKEHLDGKDLAEVGTWVYFPWNKMLVHYLSDDMHQEVRTARNKNIITRKEQERFYSYRIGLAGLSVGSHPALTIALMGGCKKMKLADPDVISASNLNRIRYDYTFVGKNKCEVAAQAIYQLNPYADLEVYTEGLTDENIEEFMSDIDLFIEEVDDLTMKIKSRIKAREKGLPVLMATDNGDSAVVDIERYDLNPDLELFNGVAGNITLKEFEQMAPQDLPKLAAKIAGPDLVVPRMLQSLAEVGKTLYSWPQLGDAATLSGVAIAYLVKRLSIGEEIISGRREINLDAIFDPNYNSTKARGERDSIRQQFMKSIGLA
jgi:hypothetical protein